MILVNNDYASIYKAPNIKMRLYDRQKWNYIGRQENECIASLAAKYV